MDWQAYRKICDIPGVFPRFAIEQAASLVSSPLSGRLLAILQSKSIQKPTDHKGGPETDMFVTNLAVADVTMIVTAIRHENDLRLSEKSCSPNLNGLFKAWLEYQKFLQEDCPRTI